MMDEDRYRIAEIVELLTDPPETDVRRWASAFIMRTLETRGHCRYLHGAYRLNDAWSLQLACESLVLAYESLREAERQFFLTLLLLVPWESIVRSTGLPLRVGKVLEVLEGVADPTILSTAAGDVIAAGPETLKRFDIGAILPGERRTEARLVFRLGAEARQTLGVRTRRIELDRLEVALSNFNPYRWETNLRPLVTWWFHAVPPDVNDRSVTRVISLIRSDADNDAGRYRLLGLMDWMRGHPHHPRADAMLEFGLNGRDGALRKAATELAAAMRRTDVLDSLARLDPDKGVRKRAEKLLGKCMKRRRRE